MKHQRIPGIAFAAALFAAAPAFGPAWAQIAGTANLGGPQPMVSTPIPDGDFAAVARRADLAGIGVDVEDDEPLSAELIDLVTTAAERRRREAVRASERHKAGHALDQGAQRHGVACGSGAGP